MSARNTKIICIANQKGGVAKTTTAINLASALALAGLKTLLIDIDPQGNASTGLGVSQDNRAVSIYQVLLGDSNIDNAILPTDIKNLHIIPSSIDLSAAEVELLTLDEKEKALKRAISQNTIGYDYILIDCPPSLGQLTINALAASNGIIIPMQCEFYALEGLSHLLKTIDFIQKNLNKSLKIIGVLLTMHDKRNKLTDDVDTDVRSYLGEIVFQTVIPRNVRISESPSHGMPVLTYDPFSSGSKAYHALTQEFLMRENIL
ncbi:MAG: ParA family protein [Rickettsiaceae bacterium]|nr:ParA family protein [Rickettsiaceae bacterium]